MQHPWFVRNLPQSRWGMNQQLLQSLVPAGLQSVEEIEQLVQQATRPAQTWPMWYHAQQQGGAGVWKTPTFFLTSPPSPRTDPSLLSVAPDAPCQKHGLWSNMWMHPDFTSGEKVDLLTGFCAPVNTQT